MFGKIIEKVLNISPAEVPRTLYAWALKLLLKIGLIAGWTTIISIFVSKYEVKNMPLLFMLQAILTIAGMLIFSFLVNRIEVRKMVVTCAFLAAILLLGSTFVYNNDFLFFSFVLLASGVFLPQLAILLSNYIEDFFTPAECERIFPAIESSETIGGLIGGLIVANTFLGNSGYKIIYIWVFFICMFLAALFVIQPKSPRFYSYLYEMKIVHKGEKLSFEAIRKSLKEISKTHFLQILMLVFALQWMMMHFLEFQYVKVVEESVHASVLTKEEGLAHGLGSLQIIFYSSALVMQLLLASRILKFIGTFGGFLFHALVSFMSSVMMMLGFGYFTTVLAKNNFELSGIVNKNAYEASYYAFRHNTQRSIREFFEGLVAPTGTVIATVVLFGIQCFFIEDHSLLAINLILVLLTGFVLSVSVYLQTAYTSMVKQNLFKAGNKIAKLNAIEILAQKGHNQAVDILIDVLRSEKDEDIKAKIVASLKKIGHINAIPAILECLKSESSKVVLSAILAITNYPGIKGKSSSAIFSRRKALDDLKCIFEESNNFQVRATALRAIARSDDNSAAFLLDVLNKVEPEMQAECLRFMGSFADPVVAEYINPYLDADDPNVRAQAVVVYANAKGMSEKLNVILEEMIAKQEKPVIMAVCSILPILNTKHVVSYAMKCLHNGDMEIRLAAAAGLLKAGKYVAGKTLADLLLDENDLILAKARQQLVNLKLNVKRLMSDLLQRELMLKAGIYSIRMSLVEMLEIVDEKLLRRLCRAYECLNMDEEEELINSIIDYREYLKKQSSLETANYIPKYITS
jgi:HEAT repeat protein/MFS family permease